MRTSERKQIIKAAEILKLDNGCIELLNWMYSMQEGGVISAFERKKWEYTTRKDLPMEVFLAMCQKLIEARFIRPYGHGGDIQILVCSQTYLQNLVHKSLKKRHYSKDPLREQNHIGSVYGAGIRQTYQYIAGKVKKPEDLSIPQSIRISIQGIKIPVAFRPYLASELLEEQELNGGIPENYKYFSFEHRYDKEYLAMLEEDRRSLTKEEKRVLLAIIFMAADGKVKHFSIPGFIETMNKTFGKVYCKQTVHDSMRRLKDLHFIRIYKDEEKVDTLEICHYSESFGQGRNFVVVPLCVLQRAFKKMQAGAIKAFFQFVFQLNNGEGVGRPEERGQSKAVYIKIGSLDTEEPGQKQKYKYNLLWLRRRSTKELKEILMGLFRKTGKKTGTEAEFTPLAEFFDFHLLENETVLQVRIRKEYFVTKKTITEAMEIDPLARYPRKARVVQEIIEGSEYKFSEQDKRSFIKIFRKAGRETIKTLIRYLEDRLKKVQEGKLKEIKNIGGYMVVLYRLYQDGNLAAEQDIQETAI